MRPAAGELALVDTSVPVLILKAAGGLLHQGHVGLVRSLGHLGVPVYSFHDARWAPGGLSCYVQGTFHWPPSGAPADVVDRLLDAAKRVGLRPVLIPVDDVSSLLVNEHAAELRPWFLFPDQPAGLASALANKQELHALCQRFAVATAEAMFPRSRAEVAAFAASTRFPVMIKAVDPNLLALRPGVRSVVIAHDAAELLDHYERGESYGPPNLMLQEYIPGEAASVWMFNGYFDASSDCLVGFTGKKLRQHPPHTGSTSLGICLSNETVRRTTCRLMKQLGYRGILDIGYRYDVRDGRYKLLDANPRIGASFRLFVGSNGIDVARALYLDLTGQSVPSSTAPDGRKWLVENHDLESSLHHIRQGELTPSAWLRSLVGVREVAWFARDDPAPFVMMLAGAALQALLWLRPSLRTRALQWLRPTPGRGGRSPTGRA